MRERVAGADGSSSARMKEPRRESDGAPPQVGASAVGARGRRPPDPGPEAGLRRQGPTTSEGRWAFP